MELSEMYDLIWDWEEKDEELRDLKKNIFLLHLNHLRGLSL